MAPTYPKTLQSLIPAMTIAFLALVFLSVPATSQLPGSVSPCTASMLTSITPCMGFLTNNGNNTSNSTAPSPGCCTSLKSLAANGTGCFCQVFVAAAPFRIPVNRSMAIALPRACNMSGVPLQCNAAAGSPAPAPASGPVATTPALSPTTAASPTTNGPTAAAEVPTASPPSTTATSPASDTDPTVAPSTTPATSTETPPATSTETPPATSSTTTSRGSDSNPTPSSAGKSYPVLLLLPLALAIVKHY